MVGRCTMADYWNKGRNTETCPMGETVNNPKRLAIAGACLYALMTVITFGRAWERGNFIIMQGAQDPMCRFFGTVTASVMWPYYWSCVIWEKKP